MTERPAILITGGAQRIGAYLSLYFARHQYDIALHYNHSQKEAFALKTQIEALGVRCELFQQDLTSIDTLPAFIETIFNILPNCNTLINNASVFERASFMDTDEALFDRQYLINFKAPFFLIQAFARKMSSGAVINMLDTDIAQTQGSHFAYLLSKKSLADFTEMAARALGPVIRVNAICPGCVLPSNEHDEAYMQKLAIMVPLKQLTNLEQLAQAAHFLSTQSSITGQLIYSDGGQHLL